MLRHTIVELVGRERQLAAVERAVEDVRGGASRVIAVVGEPGIGKTALLEATAERARAAGLLALEGRAAEHEREVPFAVAVAALDDHVATVHPRRIEAIGPALGAVLPAAANGDPRPAAAAAAPERFLHHRALRALIELLARERPVALLLDDLHWADDASLELVLHLLRRRPRAPHLLALALRSVQPAGRLLQAAGAGPGAELLTLEPLSHDASLAMVGGLPDPVLRERVAREARGNPLFLEQLARFAQLPDGTLPACLLAGVALEVGALPAAARALIEGAAVAGDPFDVELAAVAAALDCDAVAEPLDGLVAADLVRPTGHGRAFAFRHPLVRRAVYDAAPPGRRLAAHERVAAALADRGAGAGARAHHVERFARPGDDAAIALLTAAAEATNDTAPATAARWYRAALRLVPDGDTPRRAGLRAAMGLALAAAGRLEEGRAALIEVLDLLPPEPTQERLELVATCASMENLLGRPTDARRRLLAAHASAPPGSRGALALELAAVACCPGDGRDVREWAERALREIPADAPALLAAAEAIAAVGALWEGDPGAAFAALDTAAARLHDLDDTELAPRLDATVHVAMAELLTERFADAAATAARGLAIARRTGQGHVVPGLSCIAAVAHYQLLELDLAQRVLENAEESAGVENVPHVQQLVLWARLQIHALRGEQAEAMQAADEWAALLPGVEDGVLTRAGRSVVAALHGERDAARCLEELGPLVEDADVTLATSLMLPLVRAALALGRVEDADRWARRCTAHAAALRLPAGAVRAACARAEVLLARGAAAEAAAVAAEAVAAAQRAGARRDEAAARVVAGRALAGAGDAERAKAMLRRAAADARRGGADALVGEAARELRRLGSRIPTKPPSVDLRSDYDGHLTDRERGIAELVIQGRSNKQVAAELYLSEKTIESTLTRVYAKVGVRSRVELTRRLIPA